MNGDSIDVVEAIRRLVLGAQPDRAQIADAAQDFSRQVREVNAGLGRCHRWIQAGLFAEAVSFGDALDLARAAERLSLEGVMPQWLELCRAAKVPAPETVDLGLLEAYADAWSRFQSVAPFEAKHRLLALQRAPLRERLKTLRELVEHDPRNPQWLQSIGRLQRAAAAEIAPLAAQALQSKDDALAIALADLVETCGAPGGESLETLAQLQVYAVAARARAARRDAQAACADMHAAATAMDLAALHAASLRWSAAIAEFPPDADLLQSAAPSLGLLRAQQDRREREQRQRDAIGRLELALDQARPVDELRGLERAVRDSEAAVPESLQTRLAAVEDAHRAARRRRHARRGVAAVMATVVLAAAAWWVVQWMQSLEQVNAIVRETEAQLAAGAPSTAAEALAAWRGAHPDLAAAPAVAAVAARVDAEVAKERSEIELARGAIDRAAKLAATPAYPSEFEEAAAELKRLSQRSPPSIRPQLLAAADQMLAKAEASRAAALDRSRAEFLRLESALALPAMSAAEQVDPEAWKRRAVEYQTIADDAKAAAAAAANNRDAQAIAQSLQGLAANAARLREEAQRSAALYAEAADLLKAVERVPANESAYRDLYARLLSVAGDLLNRRQLLKAYEHGAKVAEGGAAVEAWRQQVVPAMLAGRSGGAGGLADVDFGDAATAKSLETTLAKHLADHPTSPHQESAQLALNLCRRTLARAGAHEGIGAAAAAWLQQSGWAGLGEQSLDDGRRIYRKRTDQLGDPWAQAVQSRGDLATAAENLKPRTPLKGRLLGVSAPWAPSQALAPLLVELPKSSWRAARNAWLDMLARQAALQTGNPVLSWHLQKDLWSAWLEFFAEESDPVDAAAAKWVRSLDALRAVSAADPFAVAAADPAARSEDVRKVALQSLGQVPDAAALLKAAQRRDQSMQEGAMPAAPVGVMLAPQDRSYPARGIGDGRDAVIVGRALEGPWRFFPVRIEHGEVLFVRDTPNPIPLSPQLIFLRGAAP